MDVEVLSKLRQAIRQTFLVSNLVGDSLLVRMRSASIGIVGMVAAVGLGLVIVVAQQGWPEVGTGPLPQAPSGVVQNDPIFMPQTAQRSVARATPGRVRSVPVRASTPAPSPASLPEAPEAPVRVAVGQPQPAGNGHRPHSTSPPTQSPTVVAQAPSQEPAAEESTAPGHSGEAPGHSGQAPGHSGEAPGHSAGAPGHSAQAPAQTSASPGNSADAPGHAAAPPPGRSGESHGGPH